LKGEDLMPLNKDKEALHRLADTVCFTENCIHATGPVFIYCTCCLHGRCVKAGKEAIDAKEQLRKMREAQT
jgi:hypothetical protein